MLWFLEEQDDPVPAATNDWLFAGAVPAGWTLTRGGLAMGHDSAGRWVSFAANTPRPYRVPTGTGGYLLGTLIEPERTQLVYKSVAPQYVTVQATSVSDSTIQTPIGLGVLKLTPNSTSAFHGFDFPFDTQRAAIIPDGTTVSIHLIFKMVGSYQYASFFLLTRSGVFKNVLVNVATGNIISHSVSSASITPTTDGFFSLQIVCDYGGGTTTPTFNMSFALDSAGNRTFAGDGASHMQVAYLGAEVGTEVTSPILSTGSIAVVRPADALSSDPTWLRPVGKSLGIQYTPLGKAQQTIIHAAGSDNLELRDSISTLSYIALVNGSNQASIHGNVAIPIADRTVVMTAGTNEFRLISDGNVVGVDELGTPPQNITAIRLGSLVTGASAGPIVFHRLKYWDSAINQTASIAFSDDLSTEGDSKVVPTLSLQSSRTIKVNETSATFTVTVSESYIGAKVDYRTVNGTAIAGIDYTSSSGTLVIEPGQVSGTITIGFPERTSYVDKSFRLELIKPVEARIGNSSCTIYLRRLDPIDTTPTSKMTFSSSLPTQWTLTRSTPGWRRGSDGVWTSVGANGYRHHFTYPGISGLLIESASAEQRLYDSVDPGWVASAATKTVLTSSSIPTGSRYVSWRETATTAEHRLSIPLSSTNCDMPSGEFTVWLIVRGVSRSNLRIITKGIDNVWKTASFSLLGIGSVYYQDPGVVTYIEQDQFISGWYQIGMNVSQGASAGVNAEIELTTKDNVDSTVFLGTSSAGFDIAHIQLESGAGITSPIIVQGASAKTIRDRDVLKSVSSDTWYKVASYSLGTRFIRLRDKPDNQRIWMAKNVDGGVNGVSSVNGVLVFDVSVNSPLSSIPLTGNGSQNSWTLPIDAIDTPISPIVAIDGTVQHSNSYSLSNGLLTLGGAPPPGSLIDVRLFRGLIRNFDIVNNGGGFVFSLPPGSNASYSSSMISIDGNIQMSSSYSINGDEILFSQQVPVSSLIDLRSFSTTLSSTELSGDGTRTAWPLLTSVGASSLIISIDGVLQPVTSYSVVSNVLTFSSPPPVNAAIDVKGVLV